MSDMPAATSAPTLLVANPSADLYGSDRMMLELVRGLVTVGWRIVVCCSKDGPLIRPLQEVGAETRIIAAPVLRKSMLTLRGLVGLAVELFRGGTRMRRVILTERPDVLLVNTVTIPFWLVMARLRRLPSVAYVHEAEAFLSRPYRFALAMPLLLADHVIFNSAVSQRVNTIGPLKQSRRSSVIANGLQGPPVTTPAREHLNGQFRILYVGRLSPRKGVDVAIRATAALVDGGVDASLALVGSVFPGYEWYEAELRTLVADLGLADRVSFHGFQPVVWPFLAAADVAVVPSRLDESFGNTLVEALLAARPVVASDHTGLREAAAGFEAVVLTAVDDIPAWTAALEQVHHDWDDYRVRARTDSRAAEIRYGTYRFYSEIQVVLARLRR